jgi:hypothetical protein
LYVDDVAIPSDRNVIQKETEKKLKYKNLNIKISVNVEYEIEIVANSVGN